MTDVTEWTTILWMAAYVCRSATANSDDPNYVSAGQKLAAGCKDAADVIYALNARVAELEGRVNPI